MNDLHAPEMGGLDALYRGGQTLDHGDGILGAVPPAVTDFFVRGILLIEGDGSVIGE